MPKHGSQLLSHALERHCRKYQKRLKLCRRDVSEDNVHELRISTRRLLALIELLRALQPLAAFGKLRKTLKRQLDGFDELRDTQVMLLEIADTLPELADLAPFMSYLQQRERELLQQTGPHIATLKAGKLKRKIHHAARRFKTRTANSDLPQAVLTGIDQIYATALERYAAIDAGNPATIHRLRIPLKKLRYMLASASAILPPLPENHLRYLQNYLTCMGDIQNSTVLLQALEAFFVDGIPEEIHRYYRQRHQALTTEFIDRRHEIFEFWRQSPESPLPWQAEPDD